MSNHKKQVETYMALQNRLVNLKYNFQLSNLSIMTEKDVAELPSQVLESRVGLLKKALDSYKVDISPEQRKMLEDVDIDSLLHTTDEKKDDKGFSL